MCSVIGDDEDSSKGRGIVVVLLSSMLLYSIYVVNQLSQVGPAMLIYMYDKV